MAVLSEEGRPRGKRRPISLAVVPFALILAALVAMAVFAPLVAPMDPNTQDLLARLKAPGFEGRSGDIFYFGSDELGRDVLSRVIYGARISLLVAFASSRFGSRYLLGSAANLLRQPAEQK